MLSGFFVTKKGKNLLAKTHDGAHIQLTRAEIGNGDVPEDQLVTDVTSLYGKVKELPLRDVKIITNDTACVPIQFTNKGILTSFELKEIGIYALDPDEGEILYIYGNTSATGDKPDEIKGESEAPLEYLFNLNLTFENGKDVKVTVDNGILYATVQELLDMADTKVDKVEGKGLSTEDYTTAEKSKLAGIEAGANKYVHPATHPVGMITGLGTAATKDVGTAEGNVVEVNSDGKIDSTLIGGGHADTADKLKTPRSIALTGGATGTATNFDGSANISIPVTGMDASKLTSGTVPMERLSPDPGAYAINPQLGPSDVLHGSLEQPTLAAIGAVDSTFTNKIAFYPYENALCEISSDGGTTWTADPNMTEPKWKKLVSENNEPNNTTFSANTQYRITISSNRYCCLNAVYFYAFTSSVSTKIGVKIERYNEYDSKWSILTPQTNALSAQPDHFWLQHTYTPFNSALGNKNHFSKVRITFIPAGNVEASSTINLRGLRWYGTYPGTDHRTIYSWDGDKNVTFPAQLKASEVYDNGQRVYSPVNKPIAADVGAAPISHTHTPTDIALTGVVTDGIDPITRQSIGSARSNKSYGLPASAITVEYSRDGGTTWVDYGLTDAEKSRLFDETRDNEVYLGKSNDKTHTTQYMLRVTIIPTDRYCTFDGVYHWMSTQGNAVNFKLERSTIGAKTTFVTVLDNQQLRGWSGHNIHYFPQGTFGGDANRTNNNYAYRLTYWMAAVTSSYGAAIIRDIRFLGLNVQYRSELRH